MKKNVLVLGTMYLDINCVNFPFDKALYAHRETVGDGYTLDVGGSALNFARLIRHLDIDATIIGKIGKDLTGEMLKKLVVQNAITPAFSVDKNAQTNIAVHYIHEDGTSIMSSCGSANQTLDYENVIKELKLHINSSSYLYIGGFFKLKKLLPKMPQLLKEIKQINPQIQIILDHGRVNNIVTQADKEILHKLFPYINIYLPSIDEFLNVWKAKDVEKGIKNMSSLAHPTTVIKQGRNEVIGFSNENLIRIKPFTVNSNHLNTVGAGDSFNAGFITAFSKGESLEKSIYFANATAAIKITQKIPTLDDVNSFLRNNFPDKNQTNY